MVEALARIRCVLVGTTHPGNIGASARAMKAMGLRQLALVSPLHFPAAEATARAAGADDLLAEAVVVESLDDVLRDCVWVLGTTARRRGHSVPVLTPEVAVRQLIAHASVSPVAILFGRESSGLTNTELDCCNALVQIPTAPDFRSLNLGAAVQLLTYLCRREAFAEESADPVPDGGPDRPASQAELSALFEHYERALIAIEFLDPDEPRQLMRRLRHLYLRSGLTVSEVQILRGILTHTERGGARGRADT